MSNVILTPSVQSLLLKLRSNGQELGTGTGFIAQSSKGPVLLTNWHVVSGRSPYTNQPLSERGLIPDEVEIIHNHTSRPGWWIERFESLYSGSTPRWIEHPTLRNQADFVALPLTQLDEVKLYPYLEPNTDAPIRIRPAEIVSVVGFPFGLQAGGSFAVWATGFIASEPAVDFDKLPMFLIDCRTRPGQSGSPVIAYRNGTNLETDDGVSTTYIGNVQRFLGIYSGRINAESDLGMVWKASAIRELIDSI